MYSSGSVPMATNSGHSHSGQTYFRWSKHDSGPPILAEPAHNNRVEFPPRNSGADLRDVGNSGHVCHSPQHASSPVYISNLGASNTVIDALSQDWQGKSMFMFPPFPLLSKDLICLVLQLLK